MSTAKPLVLLTTWAAQNYQYLILGPSAPRGDAWDWGTPVGSGAGIYALFDKEKLVYIGKDSCLESRLQQHQTAMKYARGQDYTSYACIEVPEDICGHVEVAHIHALQPPNNRKYEPSRWAGHDTMVGLVKDAWSTKQ